MSNLSLQEYIQLCLELLPRQPAAGIELEFVNDCIQAGHASDLNPQECVDIIRQAGVLIERRGVL